MGTTAKATPAIWTPTAAATSPTIGSATRLPPLLSVPSSAITLPWVSTGAERCISVRAGTTKNDVTQPQTPIPRNATAGTDVPM